CRQRCNGGGSGGRGAAGDHRAGPRGRVHRRSPRGEWSDDRRVEYQQAAEFEGETRLAGSGMTESPVAARRREYDASTHQLEGAPGNAEREAAKREIIAFFKKVDGQLGELTQLKEDIRQLVDRY